MAYICLMADVFMNMVTLKEDIQNGIPFILTAGRKRFVHS